MMIHVVLSGRLLLCLVFLVAGFGKLQDRAGSRQLMIDFGLPRALGGPLAVALPILEIAVAIALLPSPLAWFGAWGALALLALFIAGIGVALLRGRKPDCHCFGKLS